MLLSTHLQDPRDQGGQAWRSKGKLECIKPGCPRELCWVEARDEERVRKVFLPQVNGQEERRPVSRSIPHNPCARSVACLRMLCVAGQAAATCWRPSVLTTPGRGHRAALQPAC